MPSRIVDALGVALAVALAVAVGSAIGLNEASPTARSVPPPVTARARATPVETTPAAVAADDPVDRYVALRADANPRPRLALVERWDREARAADDVGVLTQAMVDPDETVRKRAAELLERRLAALQRPSKGNP